MAILAAEELRKMLQANTHPDSVHEKNNRALQQMTILLLHSIEIVLEDVVVEFCDAAGNIIRAQAVEIVVDNNTNTMTTSTSQKRAVTMMSAMEPNSKGGASNGEGSYFRSSTSAHDDDDGASEGSRGFFISKRARVKGVSCLICPAHAQPSHDNDNCNWSGKQLMPSEYQVVEGFDAELRAVFDCDATAHSSTDITGEVQATSSDSDADDKQKQTAFPLQCASLHASLTPIVVSIHRKQVDCIKGVVSDLEFLSLRLRYAKHRPQVRLRASDAFTKAADEVSRAERIHMLWRYALNATVASVWRARNYISRRYVAERASRRSRYIQNYKLRLARRKLLEEHPREEKEMSRSDDASNALEWFDENLHALEEELTVPDILLFRSLAETDFLSSIDREDGQRSKHPHKKWYDEWLAWGTTTVVDIMSFASHHHFLQLFNEAELKSLSESVHAINSNNGIAAAKRRIVDGDRSSRRNLPKSTSSLSSLSSSFDDNDDDTVTYVQMTIPSIRCTLYGGGNGRPCKVLDTLMKRLSMTARVTAQNPVSSSASSTQGKVEVNLAVGSFVCDAYAGDYSGRGRESCCMHIVSGADAADNNDEPCRVAVVLEDVEDGHQSCSVEISMEPIAVDVVSLVRATRFVQEVTELADDKDSYLRTALTSASRCFRNRSARRAAFLELFTSEVASTLGSETPFAFSLNSSMRMLSVDILLGEAGREVRTLRATLQNVEAQYSYGSGLDVRNSPVVRDWIIGGCASTKYLIGDLDGGKHPINSVLNETRLFMLPSKGFLSIGALSCDIVTTNSAMTVVKRKKAVAPVGISIEMTQESVFATGAAVSVRAGQLELDIDVLDFLDLRLIECQEERAVTAEATTKSPRVGDHGISVHDDDSAKPSSSARTNAADIETMYNITATFSCESMHAIVDIPSAACASQVAIGPWNCSCGAGKLTVTSSGDNLRSAHFLVAETKSFDANNATLLFAARDMCAQHHMLQTQSIDTLDAYCTATHSNLSCGRLLARVTGVPCGSAAAVSYATELEALGLVLTYSHGASDPKEDKCIRERKGMSDTGWNRADAALLINSLNMYDIVQGRAADFEHRMAILRFRSVDMKDENASNASAAHGVRVSASMDSVWEIDVDFCAVDVVVEHRSLAHFMDRLWQVSEVHDRRCASFSEEVNVASNNGGSIARTEDMQKISTSGSDANRLVCRAQLKSITFCLMTDYSSQSAVLAELSIAPINLAYDASGDKTTWACELSMKVDFHNSDTLCREPLIEEWSGIVHIETERLHWDADVLVDGGNETKISLSSKSILDVICSPATLRTASSVNEVVTRMMSPISPTEEVNNMDDIPSSVDPQSGSKSMGDVPVTTMTSSSAESTFGSSEPVFILSNETGVELAYAVWEIVSGSKGELARGTISRGSTTRIKLLSEPRLLLSSASSSSFQSLASDFAGSTRLPSRSDLGEATTASRQFYLQLFAGIDSNTTSIIRLNKVGCFHRELQLLSSPFASVPKHRIVCDIGSLKESSVCGRMIVIRSEAKLCNELAMPVDVRFESFGENLEMRLESGESTWIPAVATSISCRPASCASAKREVVMWSNAINVDSCLRRCERDETLKIRETSTALFLAYSVSESNTFGNAFRIVGECRRVKHFSFLISLFPPVRIVNALPMGVRVSCQNVRAGFPFSRSAQSAASMRDDNVTTYVEAAADASISTLVSRIDFHDADMSSDFKLVIEPEGYRKSSQIVIPSTATTSEHASTRESAEGMLDSSVLADGFIIYGADEQPARDFLRQIEVHPIEGNTDVTATVVEVQSSSPCAGFRCIHIRCKIRLTSWVVTPLILRDMDEGIDVHLPSAQSQRLIAPACADAASSPFVGMKTERAATNFAQPVPGLRMLATSFADTDRTHRDGETTLHEQKRKTNRRGSVVAPAACSSDVNEFMFAEPALIRGESRMYNSDKRQLRLRIRMEYRLCDPNIAFPYRWSDVIAVEHERYDITNLEIPAHVSSQSAARGGEGSRVLPVRIVASNNDVDVVPAFILENRTGVTLRYKQQRSVQEAALLAPNHSSVLSWSSDELPRMLNFRIDAPGWEWSGAVSLASDDTVDVVLKMSKTKENDSQTHMMRLQSFAGSYHRSTSIVGGSVSILYRQHSATTLIRVYDAGEFTPVRIDNLSKDLIRFHQSGSDVHASLLRAHASFHYAWDEPSQPKKLRLELAGGRAVLGTFGVEELGLRLVCSVRAHGGLPARELLVAVRAEGPVRVIIIADTSLHPKKHFIEFLSRTSHGQNAAVLRRPQVSHGQQRPSRQGTGERVSFSMDLSSIGISMIHEEREMAYMSAHGIRADFRRNDSLQEVSLRVMEVQLDNQDMAETTYPVVLVSPKPVRRRFASMRERSEQWGEYDGDTRTTRGAPDVMQFVPALKLSFSSWRSRPNGVFCIRMAQLGIAVTQLELEESFVRRCVHFVQAFRDHNTDESEARARGGKKLAVTRSTPSGKDVHGAYANGCVETNTTKSASDLPQQLYIEDLVIEPISLYLSWSTGDVLTQSTRNESTAFDSLRALSLAEADGVLLLLKEFHYAHKVLDESTVRRRISDHYWRELYRGMLAFLASANLLGDPLGVVRSVRSIIYKVFLSTLLPFQYLLAHDHRDATLSSFVISLSSAFRDACRSITADTILAITDTTIKLSDATRKRLESAIVSYRPEPLRSLSLGVGSMKPSESFGSLSSSEVGVDEARDGDGDGDVDASSRGPGLLDAISSGIAGLISLPIEGAESHGVIGLIQGTLIGIFEAIALPSIRLLHAQSQTARSVQLLIQSGNEVSRVRYPRLMGSEGEVLPYDDEVAVGNTLMLAPFAKTKGRFIICAKLLAPSGYLFLTSRFVGTFPKWSADMAQAHWLERIADVVHVSLSGTAVHALVLGASVYGHRRAVAGGLFFGDTTATARPIFRLRVIEFSDESKARRVFNLLKDANTVSKQRARFRLHLDQL